MEPKLSPCCNAPIYDVCPFCGREIKQDSMCNYCEEYKIIPVPAYEQCGEPVDVDERTGS